MKEPRKLPTHDFNILELLNYLYSHRLALMIPPIAFAAIVGLMTFFVRKPLYLSTATLTFEQQQTGSLNRSELEAMSMFGSNNDIRDKITRIEHFIVSVKYRYGLLERIDGLKPADMARLNEDGKRRYAVIKSYLGSVDPSDREKRAGKIFRHIRVKGDEKRGVLLLEATAPNPTLAWAIADLAKETLVDQNLERGLERVRLIKDFLVSQNDEIKNTLTELEQKLSNLRSQARIFTIDDAAARIDNSRFDTQARLSQSEGEFEAYKQMVADVTKEIMEFKKHMADPKGASYFYIVQLQKKLELLSYRKSLLEQQRKLAADGADGRPGDGSGRHGEGGGRQSYGENRQASGERRQVTGEIEQTSTELQTALKSNQQLLTKAPWEVLELLEQQLIEVEQKRDHALKETSILRKKYAESEKDLKGIPEVFRQMGELQRQIKISSTVYSDIQQRLQDARVKEAGKANDIQVLSDPEMPDAPIGLGVKMRYIFSFLIGLGLSILVFFVRYLTLPPIRNRQDLEAFDLTVIGEIPQINEIKTNEKSKKLIIRDLPSAKVATPLRQMTLSLITQIEKLKKAGKPHKTISFLSGNSGEGKTFIAGNVAYTLALSGRRILIVDMDLEKCDIDKMFSGFTPDTDEEIGGEFCYQFTKVNANLHLISPKEPSRIRDRLESFWEKVVAPKEDDYDIILVDTPNLTDFVEPLIIAKSAHMLIFVTNQRWTLLDEFRKAFEKVNVVVPDQKLAVINFSYDELRTLKNRVISSAA
jgi:uncharacterized protein involved in exopolysaccharide biosynthesis/Mrp family chromosome partitioning ATPase